MSSPVAVIGLTFRGTDLQNLDGGLWLEIVRGLAEPVEVRGRDITVPEIDWRLPTNRVADRLVLVLEGWVRGDGSTEVAQRAAFRVGVKGYQALFDPTLLPGELRAMLENGQVWTINARATSDVWEQMVPSFARVNVQMESVDPDWQIVGTYAGGTLVSPFPVAVSATVPTPSLLVGRVMVPSPAAAATSVPVPTVTAA